MDRRPFMPFYRDLKLDDAIWYGKYKGKKVYEVIDQDCDYITWCINNTANFHLNSEAFEYYMQRCELEFENSYNVQEIPKYTQPEDPSKVKLYNHKPVGDKPVMPNAEFKALCDRVADGLSLEQIREAAAPYSLEENQKNLINSIYRLVRRGFKKV